MKIFCLDCASVFDWLSFPVKGDLLIWLGHHSWSFYHPPWPWNLFDNKQIIVSQVGSIVHTPLNTEGQSHNNRDDRTLALLLCHPCIDSWSVSRLKFYPAILMLYWEHWLTYFIAFEVEFQWLRGDILSYAEIDRAVERGRTVKCHRECQTVKYIVTTSHPNTVSPPTYSPLSVLTEISFGMAAMLQSRQQGWRLCILVPYPINHSGRGKFESNLN